MPYMVRHIQVLVLLVVLGASSPSWANGTGPLDLSNFRCESTDNQVGSCEVVANQAYRVDKTFNEFGELALLGGAAGSSGATSGLIEETITNMTFSPINSYQLYLSGVGGGGYDLLAFTNVTPTAGSCSLMDGSSSILCSNLGVAHMSSFGVSFNLVAMDTLPGGYNFSIEQGPTVPAPATLLLLGSGLAGLGALAWRRRR